MTVAWMKNHQLPKKLSCSYYPPVGNGRCGACRGFRQELSYGRNSLCLE
jgi:hypothetical protein